MNAYSEFMLVHPFFTLFFVSFNLFLLYLSSLLGNIHIQEFTNHLHHSQKLLLKV